MAARNRRTDEFTGATTAAKRTDRPTIRVEPPEGAAATPKRRVSSRLMTVHEGPVHRVRVGRTSSPEDIALQLKLDAQDAGDAGDAGDAETVQADIVVAEEVRERPADAVADVEIVDAEIADGEIEAVDDLVELIDEEPVAAAAEPTPATPPSGRERPTALDLHLPVSEESTNLEIAAIADDEPGEGGGFDDTPTDPAAPPVMRSEQETIDEDGPILLADHPTPMPDPVVLPLPRAQPRRDEQARKTEPKIILSPAIVESTRQVAHGTATQEMVVVSGSVAAANWQATDVGPMPVDPRRASSPAKRGRVGRSPALLLGGVAILAVSVIGGIVLFRTVADAQRNHGQQAVSAVGMEASQPSPRRENPENTPKSDDPVAVPTPVAVAAAAADPAMFDEQPETAAERADEAAEAGDDPDDTDNSDDADAEQRATPAVVAPTRRARKRTRRARRKPTHVVVNTASDPNEPWLALRRRPRKDAPIRAQLSDGTRVTVTRKRRGWARIYVRTGTYAGKRGWAHFGWLSELQ